MPAKFLGGPEVNLDGKPKARPVLAKWMTTADNPYFSKAMVNRAWFQLFGRGLVNPVDDMNNDANPAVAPAVVGGPGRPVRLQRLRPEAALPGACATARPTSGRASRTAENADADPALYAHMTVKVMTPEQQFDSLLQVLAPNQDPRTFTPAKAGQGEPAETAR